MDYSSNSVTCGESKNVEYDGLNKTNQLSLPLYYVQ